MKRLISFTLAESATHVAISNKIRKSAFTLAEVLITLAIIGIVAVLTVPTLINNYNKKETSVRLKRFYSMMQQAIQLSEIDNGAATTWNKNSIAYLQDGSINFDKNKKLVEDFLNVYILPYLKYNKVVDSTTKTDPSHGLMFKRVYFSDGTYFEAKNGSCIDIYFDANGEKGPNEYGKDKFLFLFCNLEADKNYHFDSPNQVFGPYNSLNWQNYTTRDDAVERCKALAIECSVLLQRYDNFEFKKDYPY